MASRITSITGLQNLTGLVNFYADWNSLTSVNLSNLANLIEVDISDQNNIITDENCLTSVILTGSTAIEELRLDDSDFSAGIPNISGLTALQELDMDQCDISGDIDLSEFSALTYIDLNGNNNITSVTLPESDLSYVDISDNALTETSVNDILQWLASGSVDNGNVYLDGGTSAWPTGAGATAVTTLEGRGWNVSVNEVPPASIRIAPSTDFDIVGDFTIEMFVNVDNLDGFPRPYSFGAYPAPNAMSLESAQLYFWANNSNLINGTFNPTLGEWYHICIIGEGATAYMFIDGNEVANSPYDGSISSQGLPLTIGYGNEPNSAFNGLISNFRWTDSAVYDTAGFTVPTATLADLTDTKLLIFQGTTLNAQITDNSGNGNNATNFGATYSALNPFAGTEGSLQMGTTTTTTTVAPTTTTTTTTV